MNAAATIQPGPLAPTLAPAAVVLALALSGCSALEGEKIDYKSASQGPTLEVPPDLTQLPGASRYALPGAPVSANAMQADQATPAAQGQGAANTAALALGDVRIARDGRQRWLVVARPAGQIWEPVRQFWQDSGFTLKQADAALGIMETDWAENRAKLPQDFIRSTLGKLVDSLYSTGERDKFRTRLEAGADGGTEIYITHRGLIEVYGGASKETTVWQPRPSDPELETEFLRRLMVKLGVSQERSRAIAAAGPAAGAGSAGDATQRARMASVDGLPVLQLAEGFERAWRLVGLALDRTGFSVEDRNRSEGTYFVRYMAPDAENKEPGFLGRLFGSASAKPPLKYRIVVRSQGDARSTVSVLDEAGAPASSANAERIVRVLADDLK